MVDVGLELVGNDFDVCICAVGADELHDLGRAFVRRFHHGVDMV